MAFGLYTAVFGLVAESQRIHAFHNIVLATLVLVLTAPAAIVAFRDPEGSTPALGHLILAAAAGLGTMALALTIDPFTLPVLVAIAAMWFLRPHREPVLGSGRPSPMMLVLVAAAAVPISAYALTQAGLQRVDGSVHADFYHWVETSFTASAIPLVGLLAALRPERFRMSAWLAGISATILGAGSLLLQSHASAFDTPWAWTALGGGLLYIAIAEWERTRAGSGS